MIPYSLAKHAMPFRSPFGDVATAACRMTSSRTTTSGIECTSGRAMSARFWMSPGR
jgi:hypothetical protein